MNLGQGKTASDHGVQEVREWPMVDADSRRHAFARGLGSNGPPARRRVPRQDDGDDTINVARALACNERRAKTRMDAEIDEPPARPKHAMRLAERLARVIKVRVGEERNHRIELVVSERQSLSICTHELCDGAVLGARACKLILRDVSADHRPT
jgi:hypothetical protein